MSPCGFTRSQWVKDENWRARIRAICCLQLLTHWGRVTHICVGNLSIIGSDNGLSPSRRQAIIWTNVGILLIGPIGTNFSEMLIEIHTFSFKKIHLKKSPGKWRPFCLGLNVLNTIIISPVSEGSGDVMVLRRSRPSPAARNGVNAITQKLRDGLFSNLVYTLVVIVSWPD